MSINVALATIWIELEFILAGFQKFGNHMAWNCSSCTVGMGQTIRVPLCQPTGGWSSLESRTIHLRTSHFDRYPNVAKMIRDIF